MKVKNFFDKYGQELGLALVTGERGLERKMSLPEIERPGLKLVGYLKDLEPKRGYLFGKTEVDFLKTLDPKARLNTLKNMLTDKTPFVFVPHNMRPLKEMVVACAEQNVPLFRSSLHTMPLMSRLLFLLTDDLSPSLSCHGSLMDIFGIGLLIQGEASVGKSETALGLIKRGHRLVSDDVVKLKKKEGNYLEGCGMDISRTHMEIKGIGIVNIPKMYGMCSVKEKKSLDIVVKLEVWNDSQVCENRLKEKTISLLGVEIPYFLIPMSPGRDVVLILETIALNHKSKNKTWNNNI